MVRFLCLPEHQAPRGTGSANELHIGTVMTLRDNTLEQQLRNELDREEKRYRSLMRLSSDWYWETDQDGRFTYVSDGVRERLGFEPEHFLGKANADIATDADHPGLREYLSRVASREVFRDIRFPVKNDQGGQRHIDISGEPIFEENAFKGYRGVGRDVTEKMALAESVARLAAENRSLVEHSLDIIALFDEDGRFLRVNKAIRDILGYSQEEVLGRRYEEFVVAANSSYAQIPGRRQRISKNTIRDFESCWVRKDGGIVHLSWTAQWSDDRRHVYATARDVTERHQAREALRRSNDRLAGVLESIGDGFFSVDPGWHITFANHKAAEFFGHTPETLIGKLLQEAMPELHSSPVYRHFQQAMETREQAFFEAYHDSASAWIEVRVYPHDEGLSVFYSDVTARHIAQAAVTDSERRLREIIDMTPAGHFRTDASAVFIEVNPAFCALSGYDERELVGHSVMALFAGSPSNGAFFSKSAITSVRGAESAIRHKKGHLVPVLVNVNIQRDPQGNSVALIAFVTDVTKLKQAESRFEQLATHDTLTGLPNRMQLNERMQQILDSAPRQEFNAVMFIDLDRFKEVNDSMGHKAGDILLCEVARRLKDGMRPGDIVARLGGDEFVVVAHCASGTDSAARIAEKLLSSLSAPIDIEGQEVFVGGSIGISMYPQDGQTRELLFQNADTAMYRAKAAGRNCYRFFNEEMSVDAKNRMTLENALYRALERREFELHYQPQFNLSTLEITGVEALIRWNHPQLGRLSPAQFIPVAEERGLIAAIGQWVLEEACLQTQRLIKKSGRPLRVAVNLSPVQLKTGNIVDQIEATLKKVGFPPQLLEIELPEPALAKDSDRSKAILESLASLGIRMIVDDFGTGHSGLASLRYFPIDSIKLDQSFVMQEVDDGVDAVTFLKAVTDLAHALNLTVVAEGVETERTLHLLRRVACDAAQGYLLARPMPMDELAALLGDPSKLESTLREKLPRV